MDRERLAWLRLGAALGDGVALAALWLVIVALRAPFASGWLRAVDPGLHRPLAILLVPLWIACLRSVGSYRGLRRKPLRTLAGEVLRAAALGTVAAAAVLFALDLDWVSRTTLGAWAIASVPAVVSVREFQALALRVLRRRRFDPHRLLLVGTEPETDAWFRNPEWGIERAGLIARDPVLLADTLAREAVDEVLLTGPFGGDVAVLAQVCDDFGVPLSLDTTLPGAASRPELADFEGRVLLTFARVPRGEGAMLVKRGVDLVVSAIGVVFTIPLVGVLALAIHVSSGSPVFFGQQRVGRFGRSFTMWKFRTMVPDAERRLAEVASHNEVDGPAFKLRGDPRITPIGAFLRRTSLDELPQLWNVLRGEMSLVGPRPPLRSEVDRYERWQLRRLSMKPGLTGLWQVSGRSNLPFERWMALDLEYIDRWSLWLDLLVLARTVPAVVRGTGAR